MDRQIITELCGYDRWATERIFDAAQDLSIEILHNRTGAGYGPIFDTLVHLVAADVVWLSRLNGASPTSLMQPSEFRSLDDVRNRWRILHDELASFLNQQSLDSPEKDVSYLNTQGVTFTRPIRHILLHVVNHGTHHRSELSAMLTIAGTPPKSLDLHDYLAQIARQP